MHELRRWVLAVMLAVSPVTVTYAQTVSHTPPPQLTCPGDQVVWVNKNSGVYHFKGERYFGSTKNGKFICEKDALHEGDRPTRNGQ
jgi:hypothetical protein